MVSECKIPIAECNIPEKARRNRARELKELFEPRGYLYSHLM
jgi:hypothetical protein